MSEHALKTNAPTRSLVPSNVTSAKLRVEGARTLEELEIHADAWTQLAEVSAPHSPLFGYEWTRTFLTHRLQPSEHWQCAFAFRGSRLVGVLVLVISPHPLFGMLAPKLRTTTDLHTLFGGPVLCEESERHEVAAALLREHLRLSPRSSSVTFERLIEGADYADIVTHVDLRHFAITRPSGVEGCVLDTHSTYDDHLKTLGSKTRSRLRAAERRLERTGTLTHRIVRDHEHLNDALTAFVELEGSGWKGRNGTAIRCNEADRCFYDALCDALGPRDGMQIHLLELDGRPVSAEMAFLFGRKLTIQKLAYDEALAKCSPGHVLWNHTMRMAFDDPTIDSVDTITTDAIRMRWNMIPYRYVDRTLYSRSLVSRLTSYWPARLRCRAAAMRDSMRSKKKERTSDSE